MSAPNFKKEAADAGTGAGVGRRPDSFAKWAIIAGAGLALLVGCISPDATTLVFLAGALLLLGLLLLLQRLALRTGRLAVRVDPRIVLLVISLCLGPVLAELGLRVFLFQDFPDWNRMTPATGATLGFQHDRRLGWFPVPHSRKSLLVGQRTVTVVHNSQGFRDVEPSLDQRPGILFLGDSFLWGAGLEAAERFTDKLRAGHPEWQIYNCGVVGYGTDQEYLLLQDQFEKYHPRAVFLLFCTENDYTDNCSNGGGRMIFKPYFTDTAEGLRLHGVPAPVPDWVFCQRHPWLSKLHLARLSMRAYGNLRSPRPPRLFDKRITPAILTALQRYVAEHGAAFYVGLTEPDLELERFLEQSQVPHVDLSTDLRVEGDFHWSAEGNTVVAGKIERFLKELPGGAGMIR